jgi:hypothetical protein
MADQAGHSATAVRAAQTALLSRIAAATEADRALAEVVAGAHAAAVEALRRLDEIEADIESVVAHQDTLALDTPAGARELQRFLIVKQREIVAIISATAAEDEAKKAVLEGLSAHYAALPGAAAT